MPGTRRLRPAVVVLATLATLLLAATCTAADLLEVELRGRLLDADGAPVAGAVVFVPVSGAAPVTPEVVAVQAGSCQAPSEDHVANACARGCHCRLIDVTPK